MKRFISTILTIICILMLCPAVVTYALGLEPSSLTIVMKYGDMPLEGIHVAVCRVADASEQGGGIVYDAVPEFADAHPDFTDLTTEKNIELAALLDAYSINNDISRQSGVTGGSGKAVFSDLSAGLYLVAQTDAETSEYIIAPYLVSVPALSENGDGWNYDVIAYPKTEPVKRDTEPSSEKILISGKKTWNHVDNPNVYWPDSITLILKADGAVVLEKKITAADNWSWNIEAPKYAEDGHKIVYTVNEARIDDYAKYIKGYSIHNAYHPGWNTDLPEPDVPYTGEPKDDDPGDDHGNDLKKFPLPITGGLGTILYTAGGVALVGTAIFLFIIAARKKKEKDEDVNNINSEKDLR